MSSSEVSAIALSGSASTRASLWHCGPRMAISLDSPGPSGKLIVSIVCDFGERYLSNPVYAELPDVEFGAEVAAAIG